MIGKRFRPLPFIFANYNFTLSCFFGDIFCSYVLKQYAYLHNILWLFTNITQISQLFSCAILIKNNCIYF